MLTKVHAWLGGRGEFAHALRQSIVLATVALLGFALVAGIWGLAGTTSGVDFHLVVETIAVAAALTGLYAERVAARVERRHTAMQAVRKELTDNVELVENDRRFEPQDPHRPEPRIYPRVEVAATDACLAQAALAEDRDAQRVQALANWREHARTFNRTLGVIELVCYGVSFANRKMLRVIVEADREVQEEREQMVAETMKVLGLVGADLPRVSPLAHAVPQTEAAR